MSAANFAFIAVVNMMLQQRRAAEERARREAKERAWIEQETAEYNRIKESALKKASEPEKFWQLILTGKLKRKTHTVIIMNIMKTARQKVLRMLPVRYRNMTRKER